MLFLATFAVAVSLASAIQFTSPAANATLNKAENYELTWSAVNTDPDKFSIYLVNFVNWPPFYTLLAEDVETASAAHTVRLPCDVDTSGGFQFNAINGTNVYVIYAQTPKFSISGGPCTDPATTSACASAPASTVTVTVSKTLSSLFHDNAAESTTSVASRSPTTVQSHITRGAKCPDTIGWGESGYNYPVTLTSAPHPPDKLLTTSEPAATSSFEPDSESISKVYLTVYKDLSEVVDSGSC